MHLRNFINASIPTRLLVTFLLMAIVIGLSVVPGQGQYADTVFSWLLIATPNLLQKILHVLNYAALAFLWVWTLERFRPSAARYLLAFALAVGLGILLEWWQTMVPGRFGSFADVLVNTLGAVIGLVFARQSGLMESGS